MAKFITRRKLLKIAAPAVLVPGTLLRWSMEARAWTHGGGGSNGWTVFTPTFTGGNTTLAQQAGTGYTGTGTRAVYVAASGNDGNPGTQASPVLTISKGVSLLRTAHPDWLLFNKGDTWTNQTMAIGSIAGISSSQPILVTAYGSGALPLFKTTAGFDGLNLSGADNIAINQLEFYDYQRNPSDPSYNSGTTGNTENSILLSSGSPTWILIEGCKFSWYATCSIEPASFLSGFVCRLRRNIFAFNYCTSATAQGFYMLNVGQPYFEQNFYYHNGWGNGQNQNTQSRNKYVDFECGPVTSIGEITISSSAEGVQYRSGGTITNLLAVDNSTGLQIGTADSNVPTPTPCAFANATQCVIQKSRGINGTPQGQGIEFLLCTNGGSGIQANNNIIAHNGGDKSTFNDGNDPLFFETNSNGCTAINNILYDWENASNNQLAVVDNGTGNTSSPNAVDLKALNTAGYPDPTRTVDSYMVSIGQGTSLADFVTKCLAQTEDNWSNLYTAQAVNTYIRAGFGL